MKISFEFQVSAKAHIFLVNTHNRGTVNKSFRDPKMPFATPSNLVRSFSLRGQFSNQNHLSCERPAASANYKADLRVVTMIESRRIDTDRIRPVRDFGPIKFQKQSHDCDHAY